MLQGRNHPLCQGHYRQQPEKQVGGEILGVEGYQENQGQREIYPELTLLVPDKYIPTQQMEPSAQDAVDRKLHQRGGGVVFHGVEHIGKAAAPDGAVKEEGRILVDCLNNFCQIECFGNFCIL